MVKVSVFLEEDKHRELKVLAIDRKLSLSRLIEHIVEVYQKDLARRKKTAA